MSNPIEMEKRFQVLPSDLDDFLKNKKFISSKLVVDEYLDTSDGLFYQDGIFIRLRNGKSLDFKFNPEHLGVNNVNEHVTCHEYNVALSFELSSTHVFETLEKMISIKCPEPYTYLEFLKTNNLETLLILDKKRTTYEDDLFVIAVDEFADFGIFLELEAKDNNMQKEAFLSEVAKATKGMKITEFNSGYIELRLRQINEQLYLKGKYLIDSDVAA
ncbi:MAG: CYTH domain-containing protein [Alphaproteobacteria bacterium]